MKERHLAALYDALEYLNSLRESNDIKIWSRVLEKTSAALGAGTGVYFYFDTLARQLVPFYTVGADTRSEKSVAVPVGEGFCGWVAKFRESAFIPDISKDSRFNAKYDCCPLGEPDSALAVPLHVQFDFVGVFELFNKDGSSFDDDDRKFAQAVVQATSHTIRRLRLEETVSRVTAYNSSILENLTGGFLAVDLQGRVMICNPAARRILDIHFDPTDKAIDEVLGAIIELASVLRSTLSTKQTVKRQEIRWSLRGEKRLLGYSTLLIRDTQGVFAGAGVSFQDITSLAAS